MNSHDTAIKIIMQISSMDQFIGTHMFVVLAITQNVIQLMHMSSQVLSPVCSTICTSTELVTMY